MTDLANNPEMSAGDGVFRPPLRPTWLYPLLTFFVVATHVAFFASGIYWPKSQMIDLSSINAELVPEGGIEAELAPEGDSLEAEATTEVPLEGIEEPEAFLPPPLVMEPEAKPLPDKKEVVEKVKEVEKKGKELRAAENANERREARARLRYGVPGGRGQGSGASRVGSRDGVPGGRGQGSGASQAVCLAQVAASVRQHTPAVTSLGPGTAHVTFYINSGGGISGVSVSASTPAHAALARRIAASSRGPSSCGSAFASQTIIFQ